MSASYYLQQALLELVKATPQKQRLVQAFSKYLVDEEGRLTHYMDPSVTPESPEFRKAIP
jgi:glutathione peroxidase-family protein